MGNDLLLDRALELFAACPEAPGLCLWCRVVAELVGPRPEAS
jgi:hypothetical protein